MTEGTNRAMPACVLGWLVPGAGHLYLGKKSKGLLFLGAIGVLLLLGVTMDARLELYLGLEDPLEFLFSLAKIAAGLPYFVARGLGYGSASDSLITSVTHEYGNTFTAVGGLLNILVILDAYDIALGRKA